jgi:DNA-binding response OmpR family regulator
MLKKILLIEDEKFLADLLSRELERAGFDVLTANTGESGLEKMSIFKPNLVLLDMLLPDGDGFSVLEKKKTNPLIRSIPVIIISNSGQPVEVEKALEYGVKDYLIKAQFDPKEVLDKVKQELMQDNMETTIITESSGSTTGTIALIEDDALLSELLKKKLTNTGYTVHHAIEGREGLDIIRNQMPDIVVLDLLLPGMDGFEILKAIKSDKLIQDIPVLLLSNLGHENDLSKGRDLGAANFLIKASVTLDEIITEINRIIEHKGVLKK